MEIANKMLQHILPISVYFQYQDIENWQILQIKQIQSHYYIYLLHKVKKKILLKGRNLLAVRKYEENYDSKRRIHIFRSFSTDEVIRHQMKRNDT